MNPDDVSRLLRYIRMVREDERVGGKVSADAREAFIHVWVTKLADVPYDFAAACVDAHYEAEPPQGMTRVPPFRIEDVLRPWAKAQRREQQQEDQRARREHMAEESRPVLDDPMSLADVLGDMVAKGELPAAIPEQPGLNRMPAWTRLLAAKAAATAAEIRAQGGNPASQGDGFPASIPKVVEPREVSEWERRERRCRTFGCACDHTRCRDGWLDEEQAMIVPHDPHHSGVVRCPRCEADMVAAAENAPKKQKRGRWS